MERDGIVSTLGTMNHPLQLVLGLITVWGDKLTDLSRGILFGETICPVATAVNHSITTDPPIMSVWSTSSREFRVLLADGQLMTMQVDTETPRVTVTAIVDIGNYELVAACGRLVLAYDDVALCNDTTYLISIGDEPLLDVVATLGGIYETLHVLNNDAICCQTTGKRWDLFTEDTGFKRAVRLPSLPALFHDGQYRYIKAL